MWPDGYLPPNVTIDQLVREAQGFDGKEVELLNLRVAAVTSDRNIPYLIVQQHVDGAKLRVIAAQDGKRAFESICASRAGDSLYRVTGRFHNGRAVGDGPSQLPHILAYAVSNQRLSKLPLSKQPVAATALYPR